MSKPRPTLRPLVIPPPTTSPSIRNITAIHKPIQTFTTSTTGKEKPTSPSILTPSTLTAIPLTPPLAASQGSRNGSTPAATENIPLTPLPNYTNTNTNTSQTATRHNPPTSTPHPGTPGRQWESDLEYAAAAAKARDILGMDGQQKSLKKEEEKEGKGGALRTRRQDLRMKAEIIAAVVGAVVGVVGLVVYFGVLKARGEV